MFSQITKKFADWLKEVNEKGAPEDPEKSLEILNYDFMILMDDWKLLDEDQQKDLQVKEHFLDAQKCFHELGSIFIMAIRQEQQSEMEQNQEQNVTEELSSTEDVERSSEIEQSMNAQGGKQEMQVDEEELLQGPPDISSLAFADHVRVLNPIFALPPMSSVDEASINEIILSIMEVSERATELNVSVQSQHRTLMAFVHGLLDITTQQLWNWRMMDTEPSWNDLVCFLTRRAKTIDPMEKRRSLMQEPGYARASTSYARPGTSYSSAVASAGQGAVGTSYGATGTIPKIKPSDNQGAGGSQPKVQKMHCPQCKGDHALIRCQKFRAMSFNERQRAVRNDLMCQNCLVLSHSTHQCPKGPCKKCGVKHNSLLGCADRAPKK